MFFFLTLYGKVMSFVLPKKALQWSNSCRFGKKSSIYKNPEKLGVRENNKKRKAWEPMFSSLCAVDISSLSLSLSSLLFTLILGENLASWLYWNSNFQLFGSSWTIGFCVGFTRRPTCHLPLQLQWPHLIKIKKKKKKASVVFTKTKRWNR